MRGKRRLLLLLKPFDVYPPSVQLGLSNAHAHALAPIPNPQILDHLHNRRKVHKDAVNFCLDILRHKSVDCKHLFRANMSQPIRDYDLVVTIGGDGTLLQASHFMDDSIPVLGVNSDPTQEDEVQHFSNDFDATRSTGYLCAATVKNFEKVLDDILEDRKNPSELSRISISINSQLLSTQALNDILIAHPCPATVSRFSFKIQKDGKSRTPLVNSRSSGLRVSTAAGSTAAMLSGGGFRMPILSPDIQYMVREPISPGAATSCLMHGVIKSDESMKALWYSEKGVIYIDGSHVLHHIQYGDTIEFSSKAPVLKVFLPCHMLSKKGCEPLSAELHSMKYRNSCVNVRQKGNFG